MVLRAGQWNILKTFSRYRYRICVTIVLACCQLAALERGGRAEDVIGDGGADRLAGSDEGSRS